MYENEGRSIQEIAVQFNICRQAVYERLKEQDIHQGQTQGIVATAMRV